MVQTIKFSQFALADLSNNANTVVGVGGGINIQGMNPNQWSVAGRPLTPFNGLMGYNTDLSKYEYWDASISEWVQFLTSASGLDWSIVTVSSIIASVNSGYIANRTSTPVSIVLPTVCNIGDIIIVLQQGSAGWSLVANVGQTIVFGNVVTSTEGAISSTQTSGDNITVRCLVDNFVWEVISTFGNPTYV